MLDHMSTLGLEPDRAGNPPSAGDYPKESLSCLGDAETFKALLVAHRRRGQAPVERRTAVGLQGSDPLRAGFHRHLAGPTQTGRDFPARPRLEAEEALLFSGSWLDLLEADAHALSCQHLSRRAPPAAPPLDVRRRRRAGGRRRATYRITPQPMKRTRSWGPGPHERRPMYRMGKPTAWSRLATRSSMGGQSRQRSQKA
jgi:hypothetical protein